MSKETNASFPALIPKVPKPVERKDYIDQLVWWAVYKLSKVLTNTLKKALPIIIGLFQGAIVHISRQIFDGVLMANVLIINSRKRSNKKDVLKFCLKLNTEKVYGSCEVA